MKQIFETDVEKITACETRQALELRACIETLNELYSQLTQDVDNKRSLFSNLRDTISQNINRVSESQTRFDSFLIIVKQLYGLYRPGPVGNISRYNSQYFCTFNIVERSNTHIKLAFQVVGDNSLGNLQSPHATTLKVNGQEHPVSNISIEVNDPASKISGWVQFDVENSGQIEVRYGESGYSWATL